jgi:hypothetical protein
VPLTLTLPDEQQFSGTGRLIVALSPDGSSVVYVANGGLHLRATNQPRETPISGTPIFDRRGKDGARQLSGLVERDQLTPAGLP